MIPEVNGIWEGCPHTDQLPQNQARQQNFYQILKMIPKLFSINFRQNDTQTLLMKWTFLLSLDFLLKEPKMSPKEVAMKLKLLFCGDWRLKWTWMMLGVEARKLRKSLKNIWNLPRASTVVSMYSDCFMFFVPEFSCVFEPCVFVFLDADALWNFELCRPPVPHIFI